MKQTQILLFVLILFTLSKVITSEASLVTCKTPSADQASCLACRDFYHLYEGQCFVNILGCKSYVFGNICRKCAKGFILVNNECCDRACMHRIYNEEHADMKTSENKEELLRKAEVEGLEKSISIIAKNSVKVGQEYDILNTRSQKFGNIIRFYVDLDVEGNKFTAINDFNIITSESDFVTVTAKGE